MGRQIHYNPSRRLPKTNPKFEIGESYPYFFMPFTTCALRTPLLMVLLALSLTMNTPSVKLSGFFGHGISCTFFH
jgi:hypothetical protein